MGEKSSSKLEHLGRRIERLSVDPESIRAPLIRLLRPLLHRIGWRPKTSSSKIQALVEGYRETTDGDQRDAQKFHETRLRRATAELEDNIRAIEKATVITGRPLVAYGQWLRRHYELVVIAERTLQSEEEIDSGRVIGAVSEDLLAPPIALASAHAIEPGSAEADSADEEVQIPTDPTRILELQLDTLDHILEAAREEGAVLARRRRLLEAARQLLLETSAALAVDDSAVQTRLRSISRQITTINRMEALQLKANIGLVHQARSSFARGEREKLFAALQAIDGAALSRGDVEMARLTRQAIDLMTGGAPVDDHARRKSIKQSGEEMLGKEVAKAIRTGYRKARLFMKNTDGGDQSVTPIVYKLFHDFVAPGAERATIAAALSVDGCFDLGGVMTPTRVEEDHIKITAVPFPTQDLLLQPTQCPEDIADAVITDPRLILLDLAAGRLLTRKFLREELERRSRVVRQGEVRVYVLDGSTSMLGPRARMRDAILIAEMATLIKRLSHQRRSVRVAMFYRYFNDKLGPAKRVDSPQGAIDEIHRVLSTPRRGATDIEKALIASIDQVRKARDDDPDLARAQIVLITDGNAHVSEKKIVAAWADVGDLPVGVSVVALGEENGALRKIVAHQRARGERAFYHFLPDAYLKELVSGKIDNLSMIHLPQVPEVKAGLDGRLGELVEELADLERTREVESLRNLYESSEEERLDQETEAIEGEGRRACLEALNQDERSLNRRYQRWFPEPCRDGDSDTSLPPEAGTVEHEDLESVVVLLHTISEVIEIVDDVPLARRADAVDLFERLLPNARLSPGTYQAVLATYPSQAAGGLEALHAAVRWGVWRRMEKEGGT